MILSALIYIVLKKITNQDFFFPPMNSSFKDSEIKAWKQKVAIEKCYDKLFKKISPKGHEMYYLVIASLVYLYCIFFWKKKYTIICA